MKLSYVVIKKINEQKNQFYNRLIRSNIALCHIIQFKAL